MGPFSLLTATTVISFLEFSPWGERRGRGGDPQQGVTNRVQMEV